MSVLTVWDFDWSMVEDNSDTWVIDRLGARPAFDALKEVTALHPDLAMPACGNWHWHNPARTVNFYLPVAGVATSVRIRPDC